ncbi:MAG TPA: helix-turn-helix transcriptional regulator [Ilumatobacter sp.]|nr:helix-turn-helix transcriptional regulator [Ilumatobacter sp.]
METTAATDPSGVGPHVAAIQQALTRNAHGEVLDRVFAKLGPLYAAGHRRQVAEWLLSVPSTVVSASPGRIVEYTGALLFLARAEWVGWVPAAQAAAGTDRTLRSRVAVYQAILAGSRADLDGFERKIKESRELRAPGEGDPFDEFADAWHARMLSLTRRHSEAVWLATNLYLRPKTLISEVSSLSILAGVYAAADGLDPTQFARAAVDEWSRLGEPDLVGMTDALIVSAELALLRGDQDEAERMATAAVGVSNDRPMHLPGVRSEIMMARVEAASPEPGAADRAAARLRRVHEMLDLLPGAAQAVVELDRTLDALASTSGGPAAELSEPLTVRELLVLSQLQSDRKLDEIAADLFISSNTAKTYVARLYRKLGVHDRESAVAAGARLGLLLTTQRST